MRHSSAPCGRGKERARSLTNSQHQPLSAPLVKVRLPCVILACRNPGWLPCDFPDQPSSPPGTMPVHDQLSRYGLLLGNFATGLSVLAPAGMLAILADGLNVGIRDA